MMYQKQERNNSTALINLFTFFVDMKFDFCINKTHIGEILSMETDYLN